jgi:hypothetical protein
MAATVVLVVLVFSVGMGAMLAVANYPTYLSEVGNQNACEEAYGPDAAYVGDTGAGMSQDGALCQTDGGLKIVEGQTAPANWETATSYLDAIVSMEE